MTMIERVATALAEKFGRQTGFTEVAFWKPITRAAIEAMREPTEVMRHAGLCSVTLPRGVMENPEVPWRRMIDAALAEK